MATSQRTEDVCDGLRVRVFPNLSNRLAYGAQLFLPLGLDGYLRGAASRFDVAHLHACHNFPVCIAARRLSAASVPYVVSPNGTAPYLERRRALKWLFDRTAGRHLLPGAARVLAVSASEERQLLQLGVPRAKIRRLPNPVEFGESASPRPAEFRRRFAVPADARLVMYLGKLTPRKRVDLLIDAVARLGRRDTWLAIAGNDMGGGERRLVHQLERTGLSERSVMTGLLRGAERFDALAAADVVVYPGRHEIFGLVAFEALLCETPVIVADDSGCGELIARLGGGQVIAEGDTDRFATAIGALLDERVGWRQKARAAGRLIRAELGPDEVGRQLDDIYDEIRRHAAAA